MLSIKNAISLVAVTNTVEYKFDLKVKEPIKMLNCSLYRVFSLILEWRNKQSKYQCLNIKMIFYIVSANSLNILCIILHQNKGKWTMHWLCYVETYIKFLLIQAIICKMIVDIHGV